MADSKKYNGSTWEHRLRKLGTATDTINTLPAIIYPNDTTATVGLKGNTVQSGTPTPDSPIMPQGTGERTINLYDINAQDTTKGYENNRQLNEDGTVSVWGSVEISEYIPIKGDTAYTFNGISSYNSPCYCLYDENKQYISGHKYSGRSTIAFTSPNNARYFRFTHVKTYTNAMMVEGTYTTSTMPSFVPYGYKIPILSAGQTTPVYLGEVQTTRKVEKYKCTGDENWRFYSDSTGEYGAWQFYVDNVVNGLPFSSALSNVADYGVTAATRSRYPYGVYLVTSGTGIAFQAAGAKDIFPDVAAWKSYLQQQYAAGTPVCVWYVLSTETTGIVNEPLRKIGDYADTVSGITIPTITGKDTFDVLTTLKPSEVSLAYTGWHDASVKEWDGSQWS